MLVTFSNLQYSINGYLTINAPGTCNTLSHLPPFHGKCSNIPSQHYSPVSNSIITQLTINKSPKIIFCFEIEHLQITFPWTF